MNNKPVLFIDSGIGGLPYCIDFLKKNPDEEICYLADTQNFPYGSRTKDEISAIMIDLTEKLIKIFDPKIIVLACNTATIAALSNLREYFKDTQILFVGTVPALKPAAEKSRNKKIGVLATKQTIGGLVYSNIAAEAACSIFGLAAPDLVEFVEHKIETASEQEKIEIVRKYITEFRSKGVDSLVLGCTHFLYLLDEFKHEASDKGTEALHIEVFDSIAGVTKRIEFLLDENEKTLRAEKDRKPSNLLLTTSVTDDVSWQKRARDLNFKLSLLSATQENDICR
ncbi:MAG: glutamate racemase [Treponema sp.]|nr:glutamate racemase [Treponema sp.]MCL2251712.1 glutamate racemase [Treponema sp.]